MSIESIRGAADKLLKAPYKIGKAKNRHKADVGTYIDQLFGG